MGFGFTSTLTDFEVAILRISPWRTLIVHAGDSRVVQGFLTVVINMLSVDTMWIVKKEVCNGWGIVMIHPSPEHLSRTSQFQQFP